MKCGQKACNEEAVQRMYWPGRDPMQVCNKCGLRAGAIANAMGFYLALDSESLVNAPAKEDK
jgi:hypothetical protein